MATEKILNTRIGLKVDTLENWGTSTLPLKKGEVAFATVAATAGTGLTEPVVMMKIGEDGVKTFKDIEWNFYAKASDVLAACKTEDGLTAFINNVIANAGIATDEAMGKLAERVTKLEGDVDTEGSVAKAIKDAIDALNLDTTYVKVEDISAERTKLAGISEGANKVENVGGGKIKIDGTEVTVYEHPATHTVAEISDFDEKVKAYDYATKSEAEGYANAKDGAIEAAKKAGDDAAAALETYKGEMTTALAGKQDTIPENTYDAYGAAAQALADAKKYADENDANDNTEYHVEYDSTNKKIKLVAGADASKMEIDATDFIKDGMIESVALSEDGLNLVITWNVDSDKGENNVTTIPLSGLVDIYTGVDGTTIKVDVSSDDKISAEIKTGTIKDGHIASDAAIAKGKLASDVQTSLGLADSAVQEADIADLRNASHTHTFADADVEDAIAKKHDHTFVESELNKIADGDVAKWNAAEQNAKYYADGKVSDLADGQVKTNKEAIEAINNEETGILAQAKAYSDSLNHEDTKYTAAADGGLKLDENNAFSINDSITFIFDCGDSGVTA